MFGRKKTPRDKFPKTREMCAALTKIKGCDKLLKELDDAENTANSMGYWHSINYYTILIPKYRMEAAGISLTQMHKLLRRTILEKKASLGRTLTMMGGC